MTAPPGTPTAPMDSNMSQLPMTEEQRQELRNVLAVANLLLMACQPSAAATTAILWDQERKEPQCRIY